MSLVKLLQVSVGVHPQTFEVPAPPHVCGLVQLPQLSVPPQPSPMLPQFFPWAAQLVGVHPQTFEVPAPPHVCGLVQLPQLSEPVHPSEMVPQFLPWAKHVVSDPHTTVLLNAKTSLVEATSQLADEAVKTCDCVPVTNGRTLNASETDDDAPISPR